MTATCYRHTDRATGRSCTRCGRPACPDCLVTASIGSHCRECVKAAQPSAAVRMKFWNAKQPTLLTVLILAANVIAYVLTVVSGQGSRRLNAFERNWSLYSEAIAAGQWWRLVSSGFLHFSAMHLAFNMFALWQLGGMLERMLGRLRFGLLYVASLLAGSAGVLLLQRFGVQDGTIHGGASGAVFGLFGALAASMHARGASIMRSGLGVTLLINVVLTLSLGLSIGGHLGGFVGGAICGYAFMSVDQRLTSRTRTLAPVGVAIASIVIALVASA